MTIVTEASFFLILVLQVPLSSGDSSPGISLCVLNIDVLSQHSINTIAGHHRYRYRY